MLSNLEGERRLGREEGNELGRKEEKYQNAIKMIKKGLDLSLIGEITGSPQEVNSI
ncbi:hypothetical protein [Fredinandcohnia onubensis]|uniref:hypothetical protein n=1 Tax=Fredinandcohnia onubensis TaxID=1571209 RepID=UPI0015D496FC|nr:hypothetical protein [Fredinandcohnia onubensis]